MAEGIGSRSLQAAPITLAVIGVEASTSAVPVTTARIRAAAVIPGTVVGDAKILTAHGAVVVGNRFVIVAVVIGQTG